jgi:hypothetical protein
MLFVTCPYMCRIGVKRALHEMMCTASESEMRQCRQGIPQLSDTSVEPDPSHTLQLGEDLSETTFIVETTDVVHKHFAAPSPRKWFLCLFLDTGSWLLLTFRMQVSHV